MKQCASPFTQIYFSGVNLQLLEDRVGAGELKAVLGGLLGGVGDLTVVDDDHVAVGAALLVSPADALGELGLGVGKEELKEDTSQSIEFIICFGELAEIGKRDEGG